MNGARFAAPGVAPNSAPAVVGPASSAWSASSSVRERPLAVDGYSARKRSSASPRNGSAGPPSLTGSCAALS